MNSIINSEDIVVWIVLTVNRRMWCSDVYDDNDEICNKDETDQPFTLSRDDVYQTHLNRFQLEEWIHFEFNEPYKHFEEFNLCVLELKLLFNKTKVVISNHKWQARCLCFLNSFKPRIWINHMFSLSRIPTTNNLNDICHIQLHCSIWRSFEESSAPTMTNKVDTWFDINNDDSDEKEWEVRSISFHFWDYRNSRHWYYVIWEDVGGQQYPNTWEPEEHLKNAPVRIRQYWDRRNRRVWENQST